MGRGVALPSDQELQLLAATKDPFVQDLFDFPFLFSFDNVGRGFLSPPLGSVEEERAVVMRE